VLQGADPRAERGAPPSVSEVLVTRALFSLRSNVPLATLGDRHPVTPLPQCSINR
jgi:hypothetical protein